MRRQLATHLLSLGGRLRQFADDLDLQRGRLPILIFFHGYALAHTIRPLVLARVLRQRGYPVTLAGRGPHAVRLRQEGFEVRDVETMPQDRMDQFVSRGDYGYYDLEWIDRCVRSERTLIQMLKPGLVIHDMKPTASLSARLEGVDDARVTQAYNQPDYSEPIDLPESFSRQIGPFEDYLADRASEARQQKSFYLVADVPELHPPGSGSGYHYVGPLLDKPEEPARLDVLDEGWDTSLPLIYITCGSSGRPPDYLEDLVQGFRGRACRVIVTTAGRWSPSGGMDRAIPPENVRVVNFLPGEWILRRAELMMGVVGIGAIYQALSRGVPIIGAPEHLDQEYHLNRVAALGLGTKLDRRDFSADHLLPAIETVMAEIDQYKNRCAAFVDPLQRYAGGDTAADIVDRHFSSREKQYRADRPYLKQSDEFAHYLAVTTPGLLSRRRTRELLKKGMRKGLPHKRNGTGILVDRLDAWNWLYDREPEFFEADYRALEQRRNRFFVSENGALKARSKTQRFRVTYRYRVFPKAGDGYECLLPGQRLKLFLPYPIPRPGHQQDIKLLACAPAQLQDSHIPSLGFFYGHVTEVLAGQDPIDLSYTCELSVCEQRMEELRFKTELTEQERHRRLEVEPGIEKLPEVIQFRRGLELPEDANDEARARALYDALARSKRFVKTKDPNQSSHYSIASVLREKGGHCVTMSRAFAALCRLEGIPTREVTGALIGYPLAQDESQADNFCEPLFGHTWTEIYLHGRGWVPVEFHGIVIGEAAMTRHNVKDEKLRSLIRDNTEKYLDYYFGHLDNHRLICSESVRRIPQCLVEDPQQPEGDPGRWRASSELRYDCSLNVKCL